MKLTTMEVLEADAAELKKSKLLTAHEREDALLTNALWRSMLEVLEVQSLEEAHDVINHLQHKAQEAEEMKAKIAQIEAEIAATRIEQEKMNAS